MVFFNKKPPISMQFFVCHLSHIKNPHLSFPPLGFLMHLRLAVADSPQKRNSNCLKALLPLGFSASDSPV